MDTVKLVTVLAGGAAGGLLSVAMSPSLATAAIATMVGALCAYVVTKFDKKEAAPKTKFY